MSLFIMANAGMFPFGSLLVGSLAHSLGTPLTITLGGSLCVLSALLFAFKLPGLRRELRPIYVRKGILEESSVQTGRG